MLGKSRELESWNRKDSKKGSGLGWYSSGFAAGKAGRWLGNGTTFVFVGVLLCFFFS